MVLKYADHTKLGGIVNKEEDQEELSYLQNQSNRNWITFNTTKCKVVHLGTNNKNICYIRWKLISWNGQRWRKAWMY